MSNTNPTKTVVTLELEAGAELRSFAVYCEALAHLRASGDPTAEMQIAVVTADDAPAPTTEQTQAEALAAVRGAIAEQAVRDAEKEIVRIKESTVPVQPPQVADLEPVAPTRAEIKAALDAQYGAPEPTPAAPVTATYEEALAAMREAAGDAARGIAHVQGVLQRMGVDRLSAVAKDDAETFGRFVQLVGVAA